jgi:hypothetical protein
MIRQSITALIARVKAEIGQPSVSLQFDLWTTKNMKEAYGSLNLSLVERISTGGSVSYVLKQILLDFSVFPESSHTSVHIAAWIQRVLRRHNLGLDDIVITVPDGAGNGKKAVKLLGLPWRVCMAHNLQRCILYALGLAGATSRNPDLKALVMANRRMVGAIHHSTQNQKALAASQVKRGVCYKHVKSTDQDVVTRWNSTFTMMSTNTQLQHDFVHVFSSDTLQKVNEELLQLATADGTQEIVGDLDDFSDDDDTASRCTASTTPEDPTTHLLSQPQWNQTCAVQGFCAPCAAATTILEGDLYVTSDTAYPMILTLQAEYEKETFATPLPAPHDATQERQWRQQSYAFQPQMIRNAKKEMLRELKSRFTERGPDEQQCNSMFLNPALHKNLSLFMDATSRRNCRLRLFTTAQKRLAHASKAMQVTQPAIMPAPQQPKPSQPEVAQPASPVRAAASSSTSSAPDKDRSPSECTRKQRKVQGFDLFSAMGQVTSSMQVDAAPEDETEMDKYERLPQRLITRATQSNGQLDFLRFWADNEDSMPGLAKCARAEGSAIVTEASSERTFSTAGDVVHGRESMNTRKVEALTYIKRNKEWMPPIDSIADVYTAKP